jgi:hypothetical protein
MKAQGKRDRQKCLHGQKRKAEDMRDHWLTCNVLKGMFSDELAVEYHDASFFISKRFIETTAAGTARVRVRVFRDVDKTWAVLPTEDRATISVEQKDLVAA